MIDSTQIQKNMPVVCANNGEFAVVDHMQGTDAVKLKKDSSGKHHYIPLSWVTAVEDGRLKVDRPGDQAMREWFDSPKVS